MHVLLAILSVILVGCGSNSTGQPPVTITPSPQPVRGEVVWDKSNLRRVSTGAGIQYSGYARMAELRDKSLLTVYEADGSVVAVKSQDGGKTWSLPITVAARQDGTNMAVPDLLPLADGSILVGYNPRPYQIDPLRRFGIRTKKSYDGGLTWRDERVLYEAGYTFGNGCWEPSAIQLPSGEIQLFFANEGVYTNSNEQNISLLRSTDGGLTWSKDPQVVSWRAGSRDGMPVPVLLNNGRDVVFAIEDNGFRNFKPYIIHSTLTQNWSSPVLAISPDRWSA